MKHTHALVIGNWKLNPGTTAEAKLLYSELRKRVSKNCLATVVIAPPFLFIPEVAKTTHPKIALGAQDVHYEERGAVTGEIGAGMLASFGVQYVIIGHSERRALGETDVQINKKVHATLKRKLTPVVCIGERARDGQGQFYQDVAAQIKALAAGLTPAQLQKVVLAYEPIWAIGTGLTATAENVKEMQLFIVSTLTKLFDRKTAEKVRLVYGGSVKESNARELYGQGGMSGFLVGGASLEAAQFAAIIKATEV
jgi:triosephosphate isomerase (TIM)